MYKHWLKIDGMWDTTRISKAYKNLKEYLEKYPESKITSYIPTKGFLLDQYFCLECKQNYRDLDLDCNSMFDGSLIRLKRKPCNIVESVIAFEKMFERIV